MTKLFISVSKAPPHQSTSKSKSKSKNPRSAFLSAFMTELSSNGNLIPAFFGKDKSSFEKELLKLKDNLVSKMPNVSKG